MFSASRNAGSRAEYGVSFSSSIQAWILSITESVIPQALLKVELGEG